MDATVEWLFPDGEGGAKLPSGGVLRLAGAIPGERVRYAEIERQGRTVIGRVTEVLVASPHAQVAPCPWDARCGGCDLSRFEAAARRNALAVVAQRAFGMASPPEFIASPRQHAHRARIKLAIDGGRIGYRAARSHELVEVDTCRIAREEVQAALAKLRESALSLDGLESVEIRSDGARAVYHFQSARKKWDEGFAALRGLGDVAVDGRAVAGDPVLRLPVGGYALRCSPGSFYQVNLEINALLGAWVHDHVRQLRAERVLELYAGIGNFAVPIAGNGVPVVAVEREGSSTADLRATAQENRLPIKVTTTAAEAFDPSTEAFDVALLDPPRAGAPGVIPKILRNRPRALVYVSCHVPNAARDLKPALAAGYRLTAVRCFEMFPDSHHFETVAVLSR